MPRTTLYEYRAWPSEGLPHIEALHHLFGLGVAEIRTDTYLFSPARPNWLIVLHGAAEIEILEKTGEDGLLSVWKVIARSEFPLRRSLVRTLQEAFPAADLSHRILVPGDLISWLDADTEMFTINKRTVQFQREGCVAEISQVEADGRRAETFSLISKRADTVTEALDFLPAPRLENVDYGSWLQGRPWSANALEPVSKAFRPMPVLGAARVA
ncbi:MAG: hypothetical protein B7X53_08185 [Hyphomonas sp. 34-62-18]|nr:hypothetical protein [Hyphomonas sp. 34-62-18]OZB16718.1 MAG: hypothetical protein B7X53_08185 [Hyphomonas sp. 34-62-18]